MKTNSPFSSWLDLDLVSEARRGNREAFGALVTRHQGAACGIAYSTCGDMPASEDIAQEAFVAAWKQIAELREPGRFRAWLCGIARQLALNHVRRRTRRDDRPKSTDEIEATSTEPGPRDQVISEEEKTLLWKSLNRLPPHYRDPLVLFYREQQSISAVAEALDISEDTVKQRLSRGRIMLRDEVAGVLQGVLGATRPGAVFTLSVLGALPPVLVVAGASAKGGAAKVAASGGSTGSKLGFWAVAAPSVASGAIGLLSFYVMYRVWRSPWISEDTRRVLLRLALFSLGVALLVGGGITWIATSGGAFLRAHGYAPAPLLAGLVLAALLTHFVLAALVARVLCGDNTPADERGVRGPISPLRSANRRYVSRYRFLGLPLLSIAVGPDLKAGENRGVAKSWIAIGDVAFGGVIAIGGFAFGPIAIGSVSVGGISIGGAALGILSLGGVALGWVACGGIAVGYPCAMGGIALAVDVAIGGVAVAKHWALGGFATASEANNAVVYHFLQGQPVFEKLLRWLPRAGWISLIGLPGLIITLIQLNRLPKNPAQRV
jgi:RNA polymerase sigma factor (sigma-70 family)